MVTNRQFASGEPAADATSTPPGPVTAATFGGADARPTSGGLRCPDLIDQLGRLDDAVFEAIAGQPAALERLRKLWPEVKTAVGPGLVEESREQYVRHALMVWRKCVAGAELHDPATAIAAMDVVSLLFDE